MEIDSAELDVGDGLIAQVVSVDTAAAARLYLDRGHEPIECSFGLAGGSVVGPLVMDHHGDLSDLESVALRAYRDHYGARRRDPRFVVTGRPDSDATFAIASLLALLPEPGGEHDVMALAQLIHRNDVDPMAIRLEEEPWGPSHRWWAQQQSNRNGALAFLQGAVNWGRVAGLLVPQRELDGVMAKEAARAAKAARAPFWRQNEWVTLVESTVSGWRVWYELHTPVIVVINPSYPGKATVGCRSVEEAERLFGSGGLMNVYPHLQPEGWGSRSTVGGSPRDVFLSEDDARQAAQVIADYASQYLERRSGEAER